MNELEKKILNRLQDKFPVVSRPYLVLAKVGFISNAMIVWNIPDAKTSIAGKKISQFSEVTHCYQRPRFKDWNYNLYAMVHGRTKKICKKIANRIAQRIGFKDYIILFSDKEFKKSSPVYF